MVKEEKKGKGYGIEGLFLRNETMGGWTSQIDLRL